MRRRIFVVGAGDCYEACRPILERHFEILGLIETRGQRFGKWIGRYRIHRLEEALAIPFDNFLVVTLLDMEVLSALSDLGVDRDRVLTLDQCPGFLRELRKRVIDAAFCKRLDASYASVRISERPRLLFAINSLGGGGAERALINLLKNIDYERHDVFLLLISKAGVYLDQVPSAVNVISVFEGREQTILGMLLCKFTSSELLHEWFVRARFDIEAAYLEGWAAKVIAGGSGRRLCWVHCDLAAHHWTTRCFSPGQDERQCYMAFDKLLFVSPAARQGFSRLFDDAGSTAEVVENIFDVEAIRALAAQPLQTANTFSVVSVGRLVPIKGYDRLITAHARILAEGHYQQLVLVGEGGERQSLQALARRLGVEGSVRFAGFQENPYPFIANADVFVSSSLSEGHPLVIGEALLLGIPVVATDCSGSSGILGGGSYGMLVDNSAEGLFEGLRSMHEPAIHERYRRCAANAAGTFDTGSGLLRIERILKLPRLFGRPTRPGMRAEALAPMAGEDCWPAVKANGSEQQSPSLSTDLSRYRRREAELSRLVEDIREPSAILTMLGQRQLFKYPRPYPSEQLAGLDTALKALSPSRAVRQKLLKELEPLLCHFSACDEDVLVANSPALPGMVDRLADAFRHSVAEIAELPVPYLACLARLMLLYGHCDLYYLFRSRFAEALPSLPSAGRLIDDVYRLALANENGDAAGARACSESLSARLHEMPLPAGAGYDLLTLSRLYHEPACNLTTLLRRPEDEAFARYLEGKTVAVVGPNRNGLGSGPEIDGFDVVVRFNHLTSLGYDPLHAGHRTDCAYYVSLKPDRGCVEALASLDFAMYEAGSEYLPSRNVIGRERFKAWHYLVSPCLFDMLNSLQQALADILLFSPARVKVFNCNMYLSLDYVEGYFAVRDGGLFRSLSVHDPVSNFIFTRALFGQGSIEVDEVLRKTLAMSEADYIRALSDRYGGIWQDSVVACDPAGNRCLPPVTSRRRR